ncbi:MAG: 1,4-dihydroxy-2-naphthoate polyprenyltransferase, partial [Anaerolineae bacterium]|nr:1,4-dihydroxy-2-naphthoate polyprenyltransferase [Anaerolineae bacterium]
MVKEKILPFAEPWLLAMRPKTLPAAISPVLVGAAISISIGRFHLGPALAAMFGAVMIQIGVNFANDVADFEKGADDETRLGPTRVTQAGLLTPGQVWGGVWTSFGFATLAGIYLATLAGWPVVIIGLASLTAALLYTSGPFPLAYNGLGDLFVFIFFGLVAVAGTTYVITLSIPSAVWPAACGIGALTTAILVVNNIRDLESDKKAGRKNIPIILGRS